MQRTQPDTDQVSNRRHLPSRLHSSLRLRTSRCILHTKIITVSKCGVRITRLHNKMLSYRRETALHGALVLAKSGRLELGDNILRIL